MSERPVGLTQDVGWEVGASRTFPMSLQAAWDLMLSPAGVAIWLGEGVPLPLETGGRYETADGTAGEIRSVRPRDRVRLTWRPPDREQEATLQFALRETPTGCAIGFHAEHLVSAEDREAVRARLRGVLDRLGSA
ncbi:MAG TPA: SRPBCC domain-containing protein [Solirubrobacteraceae bacterium]|nr:SRPBCC domain-containing protein [Solirubrobacteraceae bacterium]